MNRVYVNVNQHLSTLNINVENVGSVDLGQTLCYLKELRICGPQIFLKNSF